MHTRFACGGRSRLADLTAVGVTAATLLGVTPASADTGISVTSPSFIQPYTEPTDWNSYTHVSLNSNAIPGWRVTNGNVDVFGRAAAKTSNSPVVESGSQAVDLNERCHVG